MLFESTYRSEDVPAADRFDSWREIMGHTHAPMDLSSEHAADFKAHLRFIELGAVSIWPASFHPLAFRRTPKLIRKSDPEVYHLSLVLRGTAGATWDDQELAYKPYDLHNNDSSRPYEIIARAGQGCVETVGIEIPKARLPLPRSKADQVIGRPMSGREGVGALLAQFLTSVVANASSYQPSDAPLLGTVLTDLVAALFAHTLDADDCLPSDTHRRTLVLRIQAFIQRSLHDPLLAPTMIAAAHHISLSYLHRIFQGEGTTVARYIRDQRLERARRDLIAPAMASTTIHTIAARWGFPRAADFSRAFRNAYGLSPKDYRHAELSLQRSRPTAKKLWTPR